MDGGALEADAGKADRIPNQVRSFLAQEAPRRDA
jgi:hypothetical protein